MRVKYSNWRSSSAAEVPEADAIKMAIRVMAARAVDVTTTMVDKFYFVLA